MALPEGTRLGPYEIVALIGAGGMGEVYRARDTRLDRQVAIKVLPPAFAGDHERLRRFEQEARAASRLNHPNITTLHDVGTHDGTAYLVSELLDGETLRAVLQRGPIPRRKAVDFAVQLARGLAAAHDVGVVHRDLKPENVFILRRGRVKILDLGLAKLHHPDPAAGDAPATTATATAPGVVMGTAAYMAPEQVRGLPADPRCDIFALGAILYEMLLGRRAFAGASAVETMNQVLTDEPTPLAELTPGQSPGLEALVTRCLEKDPEERFQSARDIAFALEGLTAPTDSGLAVAKPRRWRRITKTAVAAAVLLLAVLAAGWFLHRQDAVVEPLGFQRLTYRDGAIWSARFASDGQTVIYSAAWDGEPMDLFETRVGSTESRSLDLPGAHLFSLSRAGELAVTLDTRTPYSFLRFGTLARVSPASGATRPLLESVHAADWSPDGGELAVAREADGRERVEFPIGTVLYEPEGVVSGLRVSPDGERLAFFEHGQQTVVTLLDRNGDAKVLAGPFAIHSGGLAWRPGGREVWFTAAEGGLGRTKLYAVTLSGRRRIVADVPGGLFLHDIAEDGRVLAATISNRLGIRGQPPGETTERDYSWRSTSFLNDIARDGRTLLFTDSAANRRTELYLRRTDGSPAVRLGAFAFYPAAIAADGRRILAMTQAVPPQLKIVPTGTGEPQDVNLGGVALTGVAAEVAGWALEGRGILFNGTEAGGPPRLYLKNLLNGDVTAIAPAIPGTALPVLSPDGRRVAVYRPQDERIELHALDGSGHVEVPGRFDEIDHLIAWSEDGRWLYGYRNGEMPATVHRVDRSTGAMEPWKVLQPEDSSGVWRVHPIRMTPDGAAYAYTYARHSGDLYVFEGLR